MTRTPEPRSGRFGRFAYRSVKVSDPELLSGSQGAPKFDGISRDLQLFIYLVGGFNHLEKYEFVNGKDDMMGFVQCEAPGHDSVQLMNITPISLCFKDVYAYGLKTVRAF